MRIGNIVTGICLITMILFSCNSGVEIENTPAERLLCVSGSVSPQDSVLYINVFKGLRIGALINPDSAQVVNAQVTISDGEQSVTLLYSAEKKIYKAANPFLNISAGTTLHLNVTAPGQQAVEALAVIPPKPSQVVLEGKRSDGNYDFTVKWNNENAHKFYNVWANVKGEIKTTHQNQTSIYPLYANIETPDGNIYFPSDKQNTGPNEEHGTVGLAYLATSDEVILNLTVANMDETFFRFYQSYGDYQTWLDNSREFIPNFREPMPIFSNIKNGTGYFSAYNSVSVNVKIK
jgi:hypothetical protein